MQSACNDCGGKGEVINEKDRCVSCKGRKVVPENKIVEIIIEQGMQPGQKVVLYGDGEQQPGMESGDLIVVLTEKKLDGELFIRKGDDLIYNHTLTLAEALTGFELQIKHLDDRILVVTSEPNTVTKPDDVKLIPEEGMPRHKMPFEKGRLFIKFHVEFPKPEQLDERKKKMLLELLPRPRFLPRPTEEHEVVVAKSVLLQQAHPKRRKGDDDDPMEEDGEEDGEHHRGPRTQQCVGSIM